MSESNNNSSIKNYKFKELKIYASTEWLADNKKKYRQVFDRYETTYIYAELSFYNKQFDEENWDVDIELRCYKLKKNKEEVCVLTLDKRKVSKHDNVVYIREGWGHKTEGKFWKKGTYYWEAWIDGDKVAMKYFHVEDAGRTVEEDENPYIGLRSVRLFEGPPYSDLGDQERIAYKSFRSEDTRYVYVEMLLDNKYNGKNWQCELFTKFYNGARELKGQVVQLKRVEHSDEQIKIIAGWGSNANGSWRKDKYTAEIVFMDQLLAVIPFEVGDFFEEGIAPALLPHENKTLALAPTIDPSQTFEDVMKDLDNLIGLAEVKQNVRDHAKYIQFLQLRKAKGFEEKEEINVHSVFIGNPGTGKTTVAGMMGLLYQKMGLLSKGHVHVVDRVDLVGEYIGQTAPKVREAIDKARGGVLFIDEAYALARTNDDSKDFGREAIEILMREMSNGPGDLAVIVAGYPKEMKYFLDFNPGLKSRFKLFFTFKDYLPQDLSEIAKVACRDKSVVLSDKANQLIDEIIISAFRDRDRTFGNARFIYDLIEKAKINLGLRVMSTLKPSALESDDLATIQHEDVLPLQVKEKPELPKIPIDEKLLKDSLEELNEMVGIASVKEQINEMVTLVRYFLQSGKDVLNSFSLHTVLVGNPGTGKTTVARILTKIYKALGILERGQMVETDRQGLVAGFVGQTAIKTAEKVDEALGGVLFIDEAYALTMRGGGAHGDFGNEAIQTLLKRMEDHRGQFFIFAAGYPDNMEKFLKANPGLNSRFDKILKFEDYSPENLYEIGLQMLAEKKIKPSKAASEHLKKYLTYIYDYRDQYFGNARTVRSIIQEAVKNQNLRIAHAKVNNQRADANVLTLADVSSFKTDKSDFIFNRKTIGFN